jgi:hypothetical protein
MITYAESKYEKPFDWNKFFRRKIIHWMNYNLQFTNPKIG